MKTFGKFLYIIPIAVFGIMHLAMGEQMTGIVPSWLPLKIVIVYLTGLSLIAAAVALLINKKAKLAMTLLGVELLSFVILIHLLSLIGGDQNAMAMVLKDTALAGGAFFIAGSLTD